MWQKLKLACAQILNSTLNDATVAFWCHLICTWHDATFWGQNLMPAVFNVAQKLLESRDTFLSFQNMQAAPLKADWKILIKSKFMSIRN